MLWLEKLNQMKKASQKTSQQIADETGIPKSTIDKLFSGKTQKPYLNTMRLVVHAMGYTLDDLDDAPKPKNIQIDISKEKLINDFDSLNDEGKKMLLKYSSMLVASGEYDINPLQNKKRA